MPTAAVAFWHSFDSDEVNVAVTTSTSLSIDGAGGFGAVTARTTGGGLDARGV